MPDLPSSFMPGMLASGAMQMATENERAAASAEMSDLENGAH
jgi:hypothetical protein